MSQGFLFDADGFRDDLERTGAGHRLLTIAKAEEIAIENGRFTEAFDARAVSNARKAFLRKILRAGLTDRDGNPIPFHRVKRADPKTGDAQSGYKQLPDFDIDDYEFAIRDSRSRIAAEQRRFRKLCKSGSAACGDELQLRLPFDIYGHKALAAN